MWNGIFVSVFMILILFFLGIILTSITSLFLTPIFFTPRKYVKKIADIIDPNADENIVDPGVGNGRILVELAKRVKIKGYGYDISPVMAVLTRLNCLINFKTFARIDIDVVSAFDLDYKKYDKIFLHMSPNTLRVLAKRFKKQKIVGNVYSYDYEIPEKKAFKKHPLDEKHSLFEYRY